MKKFFAWFWNNKMMVTSAITTSLSSLAAAHLISAELAVKITTVSGILATLFAVAYTYFVPDAKLPAPAPEATRP